MRTVWVTERDELALSWFGIVRISNMDTVRWLLGAVNGWDRPGQIRQAQRWVTRMESAGKIRRATLGTPGGAVVWATSEVPGARKPNLFSQTTRHEIAVSAASARYAVAGFAWQEDERPAGHRRPPSGRSRTRRRRVRIADRGRAHPETRAAVRPDLHRLPAPARPRGGGAGGVPLQPGFREGRPLRTSAADCSRCCPACGCSRRLRRKHRGLAGRRPAALAQPAVRASPRAAGCQ